MTDSQWSGGGSSSTHNSNYLHVRAADIVETERSIQSLQSQLDRAYEVGDVAGSGLLAQQIAQFKAQLRTQRQHVSANREREKEEREWESAQLDKINQIKAVVEERRRETEHTKRNLRLLLSGQGQRQHAQHSQPHHSQQQHHNNSGGGSAASSFFSSVFNSSSKDSVDQSPSHPSSAAVSLDDALTRARKVIKETQVVLEKQTLIVDSVDMNEHPSTLHAAAAAAAAAAASPSADHSQQPQYDPPPPAPSLSSIKAIRKDTVQLIQSHLSHVDEFERHLNAVDACLTFLDTSIATPQRLASNDAMNSAANQQRAARQQQQQSSNRGGPMR